MHYVLSPTLQSYTPARMKKHAFSLGYILSIGLRLNVAKTKCMPFRSSRRIPTSAQKFSLTAAPLTKYKGTNFWELSLLTHLAGVTTLIRYAAKHPGA